MADRPRQTTVVRPDGREPMGLGAAIGMLVTVCPESAAWATKLRLEQARVIEVANASAGRTVVRGLRILAPGSVPVPELAGDEPQPAAEPLGPVKTREQGRRSPTETRYRPRGARTAAWLTRE